MTVNYKNTSPYFKTPQTSWYLDIMVPRPILPTDGDTLYKVDKMYEHKPHLLAYDMYGDVRLYWVFAARNKDVLVDPIYDFVTGVEIVLPSKESLMGMLNI